MVKALVSLNADLASSIALRYACQLANMISMDLQTIHVEEADHEGHPPGTGWVRRTWEKGLLETAQEEISQLINAERASCPGLTSPKMFVGERETEVLRELEEEPYDLFVEGVLYSFSSSNFYKKIRSKLYRQAPCPIILVKNLVSLKRVVLLLEDGTDLGLRVTTFSKIFEGADVEVDLFHLKFQAAGRLSFRKREEATSISRQEDSDDVLKAAKEMLLASGQTPRGSRMVHDTPVKIADSLRDYGLVVSYISHSMGKKSPLLELLSRVPSAILLCWQ